MKKKVIINNFFTLFCLRDFSSILVSFGYRAHSHAEERSYLFIFSITKLKRPTA